MSTICGHCRLPIANGETGVRHFGHYVAHTENRCVSLLSAEIERLRARVEAADVEIADLHDRISDMRDDASKTEQTLRARVAEWEQKAANWIASPEATARLDGYRELAQRLNAADARVAELERTGNAATDVIVSLGGELREPDLIESERMRSELEQDAKRYRWLRQRDLETIGVGGVFAGMTPENIVINGDDLDSAIDAAIHTQRGESERRHLEEHMDIFDAYKNWPSDIREKLSVHDLRRMGGWEPKPTGSWAIDHTAGRPILVYENCSVIEDEQARYVFGLVAADMNKAAAMPAEHDSLRARAAELESAIADLVSWFPDKPEPPQWQIRAGEHGADDAIRAARAALAKDGA